jgi:hypothetical protein
VAANETEKKGAEESTKSGLGGLFAPNAGDKNLFTA